MSVTPELLELKRKYITPGRVPELYEVGDVLGKGGFATVRVGKERREPGRKVAVKIVNPKISADPRQQKIILEEVATMVKVNALKSRNLLHFVAAHEDFSTTTQSNRLTIVSELCSGGELFDRIVKVGHYDETSAAVLVAKLASALHSLHAHRIIHRDIKPENILYSSPAPDAEPVIADFGLAKSMDHPEPVPALVGTPGYLSPEIIRERKYTPACDVWALGVITYILLCGYPPFYAEDNKVLYAQICRGAFHFHDEAWSAISDSAKDLVKRMLTVDYRHRISLKEVLAHPWVAGAMALTSAPSSASASASTAASAQPGSPGTKHLATTVANLRRFNARRKIKAAAMAAAWLGAASRATNSALASLLGPKPALLLTMSETERLTSAFRGVAGRTGTCNLEQFREVMAKLQQSHGSSSADHGLPVDRMFALFDRDGSGDIDLREFLSALARIRAATDAKAAASAAVASSSSSSSSAPGPASGAVLSPASDWRVTLRLIFDIYDTDGSGFLSPDELVEMLMATGIDMLTSAASGGDSRGSEGSDAGENGASGAGALPAVTTTRDAGVAASSAGGASTSSGGSGINAQQHHIVDEGRAEAIANIFGRMDANKDGKVTFDEFLSALDSEASIKQAILAPLTGIGV